MKPSHDLSHPAAHMCARFVHDAPGYLVTLHLQSALPNIQPGSHRAPPRRVQAKSIATRRRKKRRRAPAAATRRTTTRRRRRRRSRRI